MTDHIYKMLLDGSEGRLEARIETDDPEYWDTLKRLQEPGWMVVSNPTFAAPDFTLEGWSQATPYNNRYVRNEPA